MQIDNFLIFYRNKPLVLVEDTSFVSPLDVLKWYSFNYDFDLQHLTYASVKTVHYEAE
jgi:hypothetical protein